MIRVTPSIAIAEYELEFHFIRSPGPGGQNVNSVSTAAQLRFDAANSPSLPDEVRRRLRGVAGRRVNAAGGVVITPRRFRSQDANRADAVARLVNLVRRAAERPRRLPTAPTPQSVERRLDAKRRRSRTKQQRQAPEDA
ncbi:MAG: aminoacyl-tRNA hydrolase [Dehalococcoidia bacterium]|nr:aminoacyl-tRNA hydrolase [Dehalococcoidia bacterium]